MRSAGSRGGPRGKREQNFRNDRHKRLGFSRTAPQKVALGATDYTAQSAKKRDQLSAVSAQLLDQSGEYAFDLAKLDEAVGPFAHRLLYLGTKGGLLGYSGKSGRGAPHNRDGVVAQCTRASSCLTGFTFASDPD